MAFSKFTGAVVGCIAMGVASLGSAHAQEAFSYEWNEHTRPGNGPKSGGQLTERAKLLEDFDLHYATNGTQAGLRVNIDFEPEVIRPRRDAGGFWMAISDGPNPKNNTREYAILYGDLINNRITAYEYSGANNANSFNNPGNFIESFDGVIEFLPQTKITFDIDVSSINSFLNTDDWDGIGFGDQIGIWFHFSDTLDVAYDGNGGLTKFDLGHEGWVDFKNQHATPKNCADLPPDFPGCNPPTEVSEPASLALLGLGLTGLAVARRRRAA